MDFTATFGGRLHNQLFLLLLLELPKEPEAAEAHEGDSDGDEHDDEHTQIIRSNTTPMIIPKMEPKPEAP